MANDLVERVAAASGQRRLYLVGGSVRDALLERVPLDHDFAVSGSAMSFARAVARRLSGAFVALSPEDDEARVVVAGKVLDFVGLGRSPIETDLTRRDFTINAMALDMRTKRLWDPLSGRRDLEQGVVRMANPRAIEQDPLRALRAFRLGLELSFDLDSGLLAAVRTVNLSGIAGERIGYEMIRIMTCSDSFPVLRAMHEHGLAKKVFPEAAKLIDDDFLWGHSLGTYQAVERLMRQGFFATLQPEFDNYFREGRRAALLKLAGLFHDIAKPDTYLEKAGEVHFYGHDSLGAQMVEQMLDRRLRLSRDDTQIVITLVREHMRPHLLATGAELTDRAIRRFFRDLGVDAFGALMLAWADGYATAGRTRHLERMVVRMLQLKHADDAKPKVEPLVNGYDLIAMGLKPGPVFKVLLQDLLDLQLEGAIVTKADGIAAARRMIARGATVPTD